MSRFVKLDTHRIDLGDGDYVVVRKRLGYGERSEIQAKLSANVTPEQAMALDRMLEDAQKHSEGIDTGPKELPAELKDLQLDHKAANIETLKQSIVEWGGPGFMDEAGQLMPITAENIAALDGTAERILLELKLVQVRKTPGFTNPPTQRLSTESQTAEVQGGSTN